MPQGPQALKRVWPPGLPRGTQSPSVCGARRAPRVLPLKREHADLWAKGSPETRPGWRKPGHSGSRGTPGRWRRRHQPSFLPWN